MEPSASKCRLRAGQMGRYASHSSCQAPYTSMRSDMHHSLSILSTHPRKCAHKIDTYILPEALGLAATTFLLPGFASSVIQTARVTHGDGLISLGVWLAIEGLFIEAGPFWRDSAWQCPPTLSLGRVYKVPIGPGQCSMTG